MALGAGNEGQSEVDDGDLDEGHGEVVGAAPVGAGLTKEHHQGHLEQQSAEYLALPLALLMTSN